MFWSLAIPLWASFITFIIHINSLKPLKKKIINSLAIFSFLFLSYAVLNFHFIYRNIFCCLVSIYLILAIGARYFCLSLKVVEKLILFIFDDWMQIFFSSFLQMVSLKNKQRKKIHIIWITGYMDISVLSICLFWYT